MTTHDPRLHACRPDLADENLRGQVESARFVTGEPYSVSAGSLSLRATPSPDSRQTSEIIHGESVRVFETNGAWAWLQNESDGYVGYTDMAGLSAGSYHPTHRVAALRTYLYPEPDLKAPALDLLSMNAWIAVAGREGPFHEVPGAGWIWSGHTVETGDYDSDYGEVAMRFLGTPYLWGGRTSLGIDCSGLVQMALARCGKQAPRDSDMQADGLGAPVPYDGDESVLQRGDLVFWPGHVGIWLDPETFVHANATHMMTVAEPFARVAGHIRETTGDEVTIVRRP